MELTGWGRFPRIECRVVRPRDEAGVRAALAAGPAIARGLGRAYGDSALNQNKTIDMIGMNRMLGFDAQTGLLEAEAGVSIGEIIAAFLPRGWFPAVTPGTKFVTLGGAIAANVHGKNHHRAGSFGQSVAWLDLMLPDGTVRRCRPGDNDALFELTLGAMGLTGVILRAGLRLRSVETAWIRQRTVPCADLGAVMAAFEQMSDWTYSVAWIDCLARGEALGRSLLMLGEHAAAHELSGARAKWPYEIPTRRRRKVPLDAPSWALNRFSITAFNKLYHAKGVRAAGDTLIDWDSYFYPLDGVLDWNRIYGPKGFMQFQCVLPLAAAGPGLRALLAETAAAGQGSFLAVLKRMGREETRHSFPMEGYTLALDFARSPANLALLDRLDAIALDHGGRFYLAKDARMSAAVAHRADPRLGALADVRRERGWARALGSLQSGRLGI